MWDELRAEKRDRPFPLTVEEAERAALRIGSPRRLDPKAAGFELLLRAMAAFVVAERREQGRFSCELGELDRCVGTSASGFLPGLFGLHDRAAGRKAVDNEEVHPLDMADDRNPHQTSLTSRHGSTFERMMNAVNIPPFEEFYAAQSTRVYRLLVRRLGRQRAEDAFQETFLRALRAYGDLRHAEQLGAWVATIAERVAIDVHRRAREPVGAVEESVWDSRPPYAELEHLSAALPATERAAVVLRYGYELDYDQIGEVLGSNAVAARQAASAGVRRLRKELA